MIIFYNTKTGKIVGSIEGRVHTEEQLRMNIDDGTNEVDKIVINFKPLKRKVTKPITKQLVNRKTFEIETVITGHQEVEETYDFVPEEEKYTTFVKMVEGSGVTLTDFTVNLKDKSIMVQS